MFFKCQFTLDAKNSIRGNTSYVLGHGFEKAAIPELFYIHIKYNIVHIFFEVNKALKGHVSCHIHNLNN